MTTRRQRKEETHRRIVETASRGIRERGLAGVGVAEVMEEVGLTHGGFYAHFGSKDELIAEALAHAADSARGRYFAGLRGKRGMEWLASAVRRYLSRAHRDDVSSGCPYAALGDDAARHSAALRAVFGRELEESAAAFEAQLEVADVGRPGDRSLALLALCAGGVSLARAVDDPKLSDRILRASREFAIDALSKETQGESSGRSSDRSEG